MAIHHATRTRAEKNGILLQETDEGVVAINHQYGVRVGPVADAKEALSTCISMVEQRRIEEYDSTTKPAKKAEATAKTDNVERSESGVPLDGAVAYSEGFAAADNPYNTEVEDDEEYNAAVSWDAAWDAAADEANEAKHTGSVVDAKYREKYAELGHPDHCGDDLAVVFNNLVKTKAGTDITLVDAIADANGVDLSKYNRSNAGWQGRLRMTCRNLLARVVWLNNGVLIGPDGTEYRMSAEWMSGQRFKKPLIAPPAK